MIKDIIKEPKDIDSIYSLAVKFKTRTLVIVFGGSLIFIGFCFLLILDLRAIYISFAFFCAGLFSVIYGYRLCRQFQNTHFNGQKIWTFFGMLDYYQKK